MTKEHLEDTETYLTTEFMGGSLSGDPEAIECEIVLNGGKPKAEAFITGELPAEDKAVFVEQLREDQDLRLAVMGLRRAKLDTQKTLLNDERIKGILTQFKSFLMLSPGSTYVSGVEFTPSNIRDRDGYLERTQEGLETLFQDGEYEDIVLENAWRLAYNRKILKDMNLENASSPLGGLMGAMFAVREVERGSWTAVGPGFLEPVRLTAPTGLSTATPPFLT